MSPNAVLAVAAAVGYLLGSIPFGFLIAKSRGVDIRTVGSGNIGATNVLRFLGKKWGILVFFLDALKGVLAVLIAQWLAERYGAAVSLAGVTGAITCIIGHNFPVWLRFKGGKGIATSAGVVLGLLPLATLMISAVWALLYYTTRYVAIASIGAALALPVCVLILMKTIGRGDWTLFCFAVAAALLATWRHRTNIERLIAGTEHRFEKKAKS